MVAHPLSPASATATDTMISTDTAPPIYAQPAPIDLTGDDDDEHRPALHEPRPDSDPRAGHTWQLPPSASSYAQKGSGPQQLGAFSPAQLNSLLMKRQPSVYGHMHDPAVHQSPHIRAFQPPVSSPRSVAMPTMPARSHSHSLLSRSNVIDLTGPSPPSTPPPSSFSFSHSSDQRSSLPLNLPPKTPVFIGRLSATALVLYPIPYLCAPEPNTADSDWAAVRLIHERKPGRHTDQETIHIRAPNWTNSNGQVVQGEAFGVVEQKVANILGPMLGKGLIRLDGKVRRGPPNLPILPLQLLVQTPYGNISVVGSYLSGHSLLLDHPNLPSDLQRLAEHPYYNPHNPPPGGHARNHPANAVGGARWVAPAVHSKSVEVQRSQAEEVFKSLRSGDELEETEAPPWIATTLYPHQKKAITFLLERERERTFTSRQSSSLWQEKRDMFTGQVSWQNMVTQQEVHKEPDEAKGAILADDMGLGKTITCVSLIAATLDSAQRFAEEPLPHAKQPSAAIPPSSLSASNFAGSVWGMPDTSAMSAKDKARAAREQERLDSQYVRECRIKVKSRATLIVCPLSTISNWEDQFREHWKGEVTVVGGSSGVCAPGSAHSKSQPVPALSALSLSQPLPQLQTMKTDSPKPSPETKPAPLPKQGDRPLRVYVYHGNARRPDPLFLADFDAVITTFSTLATEFSKQTRTAASADVDDDDDEESSDVPIEYDGTGNQVLRLPTAKGKKRKKLQTTVSACEVTSPLQSVHWFRVVLDEAHSIKETGTVGCRASCDLVADRRLCLTGTPVQNKLDDVYALVKFLRLAPFDDKNTWTEYIGTPVKYGQPLGIARLQTIMKCITLRRTKDSKTQDGKMILSLPPRYDSYRLLEFNEHENAIYQKYHRESKAEFSELADKNEVMKNYVGILQSILRLRQICDHFELVEGKSLFTDGTGPELGYEDIVAAITNEGITPGRAAAIFTLLRETGTTQCVECGCELSSSTDQAGNNDGASACDMDAPPPPKRGRKAKAAQSSSRVPTRQNSPATSSSKPVLTRCQHLFCMGCYQNCVFPCWPSVSADTTRPCSVCHASLTTTDAVEVAPYFGTDPAPKRKAAKKEKRQKGSAIPSAETSTKIVALLSDLVPFSRANPHSVNYDPAGLEFQIVDDEGNGMVDGVINKTVVFSQWTSMLDKIEDALELAGIRYERLDGTMKREDRTRAMDALKHDPACEVLLVSLKAGGVGLNLTAAQRVYLMDPYWNPAVENQAVDRIHRLGQTRPVTTVRMIIKGSIEQRLIEVQKKKTALANLTLGQVSKAEMQQRRMEELHQLFEDS